MAHVIASLVLALAIGAALFLVGEAADIELLVNAGAWLTVPMTIALGLLIAAAVLGYAGAAVITALAYLVRALRR